MNGSVFVDTNVFVYMRDASEPAKQPIAAEWVRNLWAEQRGRTSIQVLSEYYATVTRKLDPGLSADEAWEDVTALLAWEPQEIDRGVIVRARDLERRYELSWWDAMIVAAAELQNCAVLLSEDLQHGMVCGTVKVRNPFAHRIEDDRSDYAPTKPLSRHRGRGRPRRSAASSAPA
ncbi:MAG TPA: PIN domain-containing protein [Gammaproteobacteria bacterium]